MFLPDYLFDTVYDVPLALLEKRGVKGLFLDIDNTLVPYDEPKPTKENLAWFDTLKAHGVTPFFVSNNDKARVETFAEGLDILYAYKVGKPSVKAYRALALKAGIPIDKTACVGDQLFTDVWSAHRLGVPCIIVKPLKTVDTAFFRFKRAMEKPFLARYKRKHRKDDDHA